MTPLHLAMHILSNLLVSVVAYCLHALEASLDLRSEFELQFYLTHRLERRGG